MDVLVWRNAGGGKVARGKGRWLGGGEKIA